MPWVAPHGWVVRLTKEPPKGKCPPGNFPRHTRYKRDGQLLKDAIIEAGGNAVLEMANCNHGCCNEEGIVRRDGSTLDTYGGNHGALRSQHQH